MKIKNLFLLTMLILAGNPALAQTATAPAAGNGTAGNPYQIATLENLYWIGASDAVVPSPTLATRMASSTYYLQTTDIDASATSGWNSGAGWNPIGNLGSNFKAKYDGDGYTISGIFINRPLENKVGLLSECGAGASVIDLGLINVNITGAGNVGGLTGLNGNTATYTNCYTTGSVNSVDGSGVGGFIGMATSTNITNCYSTCTVTVTGTLGNQGYSVGGFIGTLNNTIASGQTVTNCYATGNAASYNRYVGGFVGNLTNNGALSNCWATGNSTSGTRSVGGFAGIINTNAVSLCYSSGNATGQFQAGGFAGETNATSTITNCYSFGNATRTTGTDANFGGFIGLNRSTVTNCFSTGSVIYTGGSTPTNKGFVGVNTGGSYSNNFYDSQVSNQTSATGATATTTANMKTSASFTNAGWDFFGEATNGTNDYWNRDNTKNGGYPFLTSQTFPYTVTITDGSSFTPSPTAGQTNQAIGRIALKTDVVNAMLYGVRVVLNGTRTGATNFKLWESSDNSFSSGSDTQLGLTVATDPGDGGYISFQPVNVQFLATDKYYFLTCDLSGGATGTIQPLLAATTDINLGRSVLGSSLSNTTMSSGASPLPVELTSFTALVNGNSVQLNWITATEVNNYGFEIERMSSQTDGKWNTLGFVNGSGNSNAERRYQFTDNTPLPGKNIYRLKQIDTDGKYTYSQEVEVDFSLTPAKYTLGQNYPNPFNPETRINFAIPITSHVTIKIYDITGKEVATLLNETRQAGQHSINFNASSFSSGVYMYRLFAGEFSEARKFILIR